ncbi:MAG: hypothetical protein LBL21_05040 [Rickettsiales bacterium]|jgi:hypothetical protein|nr:hypothetical protein [Rickettsiales bacterium]
MHAKYASLHPAYPSPNRAVFVATAARETTAEDRVALLAAAADFAVAGDLLAVAAARAETLLTVAVLAAERDCAGACVWTWVWAWAWVWRFVVAAAGAREAAALRADTAADWVAGARTRAELRSAAKSGRQKRAAKNGQNAFIPKNCSKN